MEIQQNITQTEGALMFSLRNQFSPCICLSLSFSVPFNSLLSLSHLFFFSTLVQPLSIVWVGWRSTLGGLQTLLFAMVTVAILRDPEHTEGSLGAKRRRSLPYNQTGSKVARGQLSQRKCEDSWERRGAWSETETSVWWTGLVCGNSGGGWIRIRPVSMTFIFNGTFSNGISYKVTTEWKKDQTASPDLHMYSGIWEHSA